MSSRENQFQSAFGTIILERYPLEKNTPLRAWNAADELALHYLAERLNTDVTLASKSKLRILTINDQHGALAIPLHYSQSEQGLSLKAHFEQHIELHCWSDSSISQQAIANNIHNNSQQHLQHTAICPPDFIPSTQALDGTFDIVLIQIPKTLSLLEYQLRALRNHLSSDNLIIGCGMVKHLQHSYTELFERIIGPTKTSLAKKKARLILPVYDHQLALPPEAPAKQYSLEHWPLTLTNLSNVFAQNKLDIGTRFFLPHLGAEQSHIQTIFDLGCGNGALGIAASQLNNQADINFYDDSYLAVKSAEQSFQTNNISNNAQFIAMDCLSNEQQKADLILCNPPFHQSNAVGTHIALRMFKQARHHLTEHGELRVIGNRHLNYHIALKKLFKTVKVLDSNKKFVIYRACP